MVIVTEPVPVTSAAPPTGLSRPFAAHRSQKTVAVPAVVLPAKEMFESVYPYDGFGTITTAAHATADIADLGALTVELRRLPPLLVESTSTTVAPIDCGRGDLDGVGVVRGVPEMDGVPEGEREGVRDVVGETVVVGDCGSAVGGGDGVADCEAALEEPGEGVPEGEARGGTDVVGEGDSEPTLEGPGEVVLDGDVEGETVGETVLEADAPPLRLGVVVEAGVKEGEFV